MRDDRYDRFGCEHARGRFDIAQENRNRYDCGPTPRDEERPENRLEIGINGRVQHDTRVALRVSDRFDDSSENCSLFRVRDWLRAKSFDDASGASPMLPALRSNNVIARAASPAARRHRPYGEPVRAT